MTLASTYVGGWPLAAWLGLVAMAMSMEWVRIVHNERFGWRFALHALAIMSSLALGALNLPNLGLNAILVCALAGSVAAQARDERAIWVILGIVFVATPCLA